MGQHAKAEPLLQRSLKIYEANFGADHPEVARSLNNLGALYYQMGEYAKAEPPYRRSLKIWEAALDPSIPTSPRAWATSPRYTAKWASTRRPNRFYQRSLKIYESKLGPDHPAVATSLTGFASLYCAMRQYDEARPLYQRSLKIYESKFGPNHPHVARSLYGLSLLEAALEHWGDAGRQADRMRRVVRRHIDRVLPALAESEQRAFLQNDDEAAFAAVQSLGLVRRDDAALVALSATWVLNGKGVLQQALAERALSVRPGRGRGQTGAGACRRAPRTRRKRFAWYRSQRTRPDDQPSSSSNLRGRMAPSITLREGEKKIAREMKLRVE